MSVLRNLPRGSFASISRTINVLAATVALWMQKIYAYVQRELQEFSDIQEGSAEVEQHTDPAFIAYIQGEDFHPDVHCQPTARRIFKSQHLKKKSSEKNNKKACKGKKRTSTCQKRNVVRSKPNLRMKPPPVEELVFRRKRSCISIEKVCQGSKEPPRQESSDRSKFAGENHIHDCHENYSQESATRDSINSQIGAEKISIRLRLPGILLVFAVVNALLRAVEKSVLRLR